MKSGNIKKQCALCGVIFMLTGAVIGVIGGGMAGFRGANLQEYGQNEWYRTIHIEDGRVWFGIQAGDMEIMHIGF